MAEPASLEFRAMGSPCRVVVAPGRSDLAREVRDLVEDLERRWSRFWPDSEISGLNRAAGRVTIVSPQTYGLIATAVRAREATGGRFNPLMLDQLEAGGYRHSWHDGPSQADPIDPVGQLDPASLEPIQLHPEIDAVVLPEGSRFDPGGIGKGLAVDLAIEHCRAAGSPFASVELGGDLRVYGKPWYGDAWAIGVIDPFNPEVDVATMTPTEGAVTTSTTMKRRWFDGTGWNHHLLDATTGRSAATDLVSVTTCSHEAWWAEVVAKTALIAGSDGFATVLDDLATPAVAVTDAGRLLTHRPASTAGVAA